MQGESHVTVVLMLLLAMSCQAKCEFNDFTIGDCDSSNMTWIEEVHGVNRSDCEAFCSDIYSATLQSHLNSIGAYRKVHLSVVQNNSSKKCLSYKWRADDDSGILGKCTLWAEDWSEYRKTCFRLGGAKQPMLTSQILHNQTEDNKVFWSVSFSRNTILQFAVESVKFDLNIF